MSLELQSNISSLGRFRVVHKKLDGTEVDYGWASNIVTKTGQTYVLKQDQDFYLRLGKGTGTISENDKNLFTRLTPDNFTYSSVSYNSTVYNKLHTRIYYELPENIMRKLQAKYNDVHIIPVCCGKYVYTQLKNVIVTEMGLSDIGYYQYAYYNDDDSNYDNLLTHTLLKNADNQAIQVNVLEGEILEIHYALYGIVHDFEQMKTSLTMTYVDDLSNPDQTRTEEYDVFVEVKKPNLIEDNRYRTDIIGCLEDTNFYNRYWANRLDPKTGKLPTSVVIGSLYGNGTAFGYCIGDFYSNNDYPTRSRFSMPILFVPDDFTPGPITDAQNKFKIADQLYANYYCHQADYYRFYSYSYYYYYYYYYSNIYHIKDKKALWPNMTAEEYEKNMGKVYNNYGVMLDTYEKNIEEYGNIEMNYLFNMETAETYNLKKITETNDPYYNKRWWPQNNKYYNEVVKNVNNYLVTDLQKPAGSSLYIQRDAYDKTTSCVQVGARYFKISPYWGTTFQIPKNGIRMITTRPTAWNNYGESFGSTTDNSQYNSPYIQMGDYMMFMTFVNKKDGTGLKHTAGYETSFEITWTNTDVDTANINIPDAKVSFKYPKMAKGETLSFDVTGADATTTTRTMTWITIANDTPEQDLPLNVDLDAKTIKANSIGTHSFKVFSKKAGCLDVPDTITIQIVDYLRFTDHPKWNTKEWNTIVANAPTEDIQVPIKNGTLVSKPIHYVTGDDNRKYYSNEDIDNAAKADS